MQRLWNTEGEYQTVHESSMNISMSANYNKCLYEEINLFFCHDVVTRVCHFRSHLSDFHVKDFHSIVYKNLIAKGSEVWQFPVKLIVMHAVVMMSSSEEMRRDRRD